MDRNSLSEQFGVPHDNEELGDFVAGISDSDYKDVMSAVANMQRSGPESTMLRAQREIGSGLFSGSMEHIGDLSHRINEHGGKLGAEFVVPKVTSQLTHLTRPYGYKREMLEQIESNIKFGAETPNLSRVKEFGSPSADLSRVKEVGREYAESHVDIPPINAPTAAARHAAISLGHMRFSHTIKQLKNLQEMTSSDELFKSHLQRSNALDFLRRKYGR